MPDLGEVAGEWVEADRLGHLPSLRNQRGQAHVNHDLASISWLAAPPFTGGYHTGVLRIDGVSPPARRFRWKPWGVEREGGDGPLSIRTDTRLVFEAQQVLWRTTVTNTGTAAQIVEVSQDLHASIAHSETGWGWLYTVPWNGGDEHDYHTLERIRETTRGGGPYLLGPGPRRMRLGRPRLPGIQRDEDTAPMLLEHELPRHVSEDMAYPYTSAVSGTLRDLRCGDALDYPGPAELSPETEIALEAFPLSPGLTVEAEFRPAGALSDGVLLTHGNTPDSLQLGVDEDGRLWLAIGGERERADRPLTAGEWHRIRIELTADRAELFLDGVPVARTGPWTRGVRWRSVISGGTVMAADTRSAARSAYAFTVPPDQIEQWGAGARATWRLWLASGESAEIGVACAYGTDPLDVRATALAVAADFDGVADATEQGWRELWAAMFTPGNPHFSGHLPTLATADDGLARAYYMSALLVLYMRSTTAGRTRPMFLTGGPRLGATTTYYWDHTEWSRMYAMLDPAGLREWLLRALSGPYHESFGFDLWNGAPLGNYYVANDYALFRLVEHYVGVTGDVELLSVRAGKRTVLEHVEALAYGFVERRTAATGGVLADFGPDAWTVLECVPGYVHAMASFNAAYVEMLRSYAALARFLGEHDVAADADLDAATLAQAVQGLYAGKGRWHIAAPGGRSTIGHVLDFGLVAAALHDDLPAETRDEMVPFATGSLLAPPWMRALAADDPIAPYSDRPDHGAGGAFGAWPGVTAYGLAKLGRSDLAADVLRRTPEAASGGLWGQAMELLPEARVAGRGAANRDSIAGAATAEAVIAGLFGVEPGYSSLGSPRSHTVAVAGLGILSNLNLAGIPPEGRPCPVPVPQGNSSPVPPPSPPSRPA